MYSRRFWKYAAVLALIAVLEITFSSPLFATLGFEYSALMALVLSLQCGLYITSSHSERSKSERSEDVRSEESHEVYFGRDSSFRFAPLRMTVIEVLVLGCVPLLISFLSLAFIPNCSLLDGLIFYIEIAIPSALLGAGFGLAFTRLVKSRKLARWLFVGFWIVTLFLSLVPGYTNPQLYTYGWQYGFFPGLTWDESIELTNAYLIFRIENVLWVLLALGALQSWYETWSQATRAIFSIAFAISIIAAVHFNDSVGITISHDQVARKLNEHVTVGDATIRFATGSLPRDEVQKIEGDVKWYLHDIRQKYHLDAHEPITIYIYPSTEALFVSIGTRTASISKPWLSELHIAKENLHSLKHELAHVLLREKGSWPFYASWSTGLTEGAAMAVEYEYDGIYTLDEHAANILRLGYANGVSSVMAFTGFAANASQKSYVLAGSFSRFLIAQYGAERFTRVYSSLSFQKEYGKPLDRLEAEWKRWLSPLEQSLTVEDSVHFRYYYDRASIIMSPCLRRIGKLERKAEIAYHEKRYADAEELYRDAVKEGGGLTPLVMESYVMIHQSNIRGALALLDTTDSPSIRKQRAVLYKEMADLRVMTHDTLAAIPYYDSAMRVKIAASSFLSAWIARNLLGYPVASLYFYRQPDSMRSSALDSMLTNNGPRSYSAELAVNELNWRMRMNNGNIHEAQMQDKLDSLLNELQDLPAESALAIAIMQRERIEFGKMLQNRLFCPIPYRRADREIRGEFERRKAAGY